MKDKGKLTRYKANINNDITIYMNTNSMHTTSTHSATLI